jgi:hypothetical protein
MHKSGCKLMIVSWYHETKFKSDFSSRVWPLFGTIPSRLNLASALISSQRAGCGGCATALAEYIVTPLRI